MTRLLTRIKKCHCGRAVKVMAPVGTPESDLTVMATCTNGHLQPQPEKTNPLKASKKKGK